MSQLHDECLELWDALPSYTRDCLQSLIARDLPDTRDGVLVEVGRRAERRRSRRHHDGDRFNVERPHVRRQLPATPTRSITLTTPIATQILVNVPETTPPEITLEPPQINVLPPVPRAYDVRITERDENGFILAFRIEPRMSQGCAVLDGRGSVPAARFSGSRVAGA